MWRTCCYHIKCRSKCVAKCIIYLLIMCYETCSLWPHLELLLPLPYLQKVQVRTSLNCDTCCPIFQTVAHNADQHAKPIFSFQANSAAKCIIYSYNFLSFPYFERFFGCSKFLELPFLLNVFPLYLLDIYNVQDWWK